MKRKFHIKLLALLASASLMFAVGCANGAKNETPSVTGSGLQAGTATSSAIPVTEAKVTYSSDDIDAAWSEADAAAVITLNGNTVAISGSGASTNGSAAYEPEEHEFPRKYRFSPLAKTNVLIFGRENSVE